MFSNNEVLWYDPGRLILINAASKVSCLIPDPTFFFYSNKEMVMKSFLIIFVLLLFFPNALLSQKYFTKSGIISFESGTALEDVQAFNKSTTSVFDVKSGQIEFAVLMKGFEFKKALMQIHFNENYIESNKYPKSVFKGVITNIRDVDFQKSGTYNVIVKGVLEIHGVKKEVSTTGAFKVTENEVYASAKFNISIKDYNISIPGVVKDKISPIAKVRVNCRYSILNR
ncbi:MAG TPA: YceI family protein [Niabella sp.]|nr:YceI family protein [Niabella sp.]HQX18842.1 YceI family protein [Niabella sp.]HRB27136.1 YceI family protein [Niabella sp.]HRB34078.1 YceI family protein [Niabella sp.]HRB89820.1 YceI family protein [Niabella sp.]